MAAAPVVAARPALTDDIPSLAALYRRCAAEISSERGGRLAAASGLFAEPLEASLAVSLPDEDSLLAVGTIDGVALGVAAARIARLEDGTPQSAVELLYVEPEARAVGLGEALLEAVVNWSVAKGCEGLDAPALPGMRHSKNFFEAAGLVARLLVMHRRLTGPEVTSGSEPAQDSAVSIAGPAQALAPAPAAGPVATPVTPQCCVGAVVVEQGRLLLVKRGTEPGRGKWSLPGGRVEPGETLAVAVAREVLEETGVRVRARDFLGHVERIGPGYHFVILDFVAEVVTDERAGGVAAHARSLPIATGGTDAAEAAWVPLAEASRLALVYGLADFLADHGVLGR